MSKILIFIPILLFNEEDSGQLKGENACPVSLSARCLPASVSVTRVGEDLLSLPPTLSIHCHLLSVAITDSYALLLRGSALLAPPSTILLSLMGLCSLSFPSISCGLPVEWRVHPTTLYRPFLTGRTAFYDCHCRLFCHGWRVHPAHALATFVLWRSGGVSQYID